jgi:LCP family protein required for cell wall assembly
MRKSGDKIRFFAFLALLIGLIYFYSYIFFPSLMPGLLKVGVPGRPYNVLIMGTDVMYNRDTHSKTDADGNSDTIILLNINPISDRATFMSIPRDTLVVIPEYGERKLNAACPLGGPELAIKTLKNNFGLRIDHYITIHPDALVRSIDILGGVNTYVDRDMFYTDKAGKLNINFKEGRQKLSGKDAVAFIRFRMEARGDIARVERQQRFLNDVFKTIVSPLSFPKLPLLAGILISNVRTDMPLTQAIQLINAIRLTKKSHMQFMTFPGDYGEKAYVGSVWQPNMEQVTAVVKQYF